MKAKYDTIIELQAVWIKILAHFGYSKFYSKSRGLPYLVLFHDDYKTIYGTFDYDNLEVAVNVYLHTTTRGIIKTMLHEYSHYLESPSWYTRYSKKFSYQNHPYEIKAHQFADDHIDKFTDKKR